MRRQVSLIAATAVLTGTTLFAESLTLQQAMERARQSAREVVAASARSEAAHERLNQARGFRLPSLVLSETYIRTDSPAEVFALKLNQQRFSFADFMVTDPNTPDFLNTMITRFELQLPIYTGGELSGRIEQAEQAASAAQRSAEWTGNQAALEAGEAYVMLAQAREYVGLLEKARDTVAAHVKLAEAYVGQGMIVSSELLRAKVELSRVEDMLLEAQGNARVAAANLAFRLGAPQDESFELEALPSPLMPEGPLDGWLGTADGRADLASARAMLRAGEVEERVRRAAFLPRVGVVARGDLVDDTVFGSHGSSTALMAVASMNLFSGGSDKAALAAARWDLAAGRADVTRFEEGVRLSVRKAWEDVQTAMARHSTAAEAVASAQEVERITEQRFKNGVVKMIDLLDATTALREAETRELVARAGATAALLRLAVESGRRPEEVSR